MLIGILISLYSHMPAAPRPALMYVILTSSPLGRSHLIAATQVWIVAMRGMQDPWITCFSALPDPLEAEFLKPLLQFQWIPFTP